MWAVSREKVVRLKAGGSINAGWLVQTHGDVVPLVLRPTLAVVTFPHGAQSALGWYGNQQGEGYEYHLLAIGLAVALVLNGAGMWSLDAVITGH